MTFIFFSGGGYVVNWDFVLFDNSLVWLIQFTDLQGNLFRRFDPNVGTAKTGYGHVALWTSECMNQFQMLQAIYDGEVEIGSTTAGITTVLDNANFAERNAAFLDDVTVALPPEAGGFRFGATRGPNGEKVELSYRRGDGAMDNFREFCEVGAVHSAMLPGCTKLTSQYAKPYVKMNGFHHTALTIRNTTESVEFYTSIIGGKIPLIYADIQWPEPYRNLILQDDYCSAVDSNLNPDARFGFVEVGLGQYISKCSYNHDKKHINTYLLHIILIILLFCCQHFISL